MPDFSWINLDTTDPAFNLAAEQYVFDSLPQDRSWLMLWQNDRTVVIGKYQNTLAEINKEYVDENGIRVVRRLSGGGAVYHDLGNLNYSIITDAGEIENLNLKLFCEPVAAALQRMGVPAEINGRNDMTVDGKKISGNSQYMRSGRVLHHGTLLFDSDLTVLEKVLQVDQKKIRSKGLKSVRSRVTCIRPYLRENCSLAEFRALLLDQLLAETPGQEYCFTGKDISEIERIRKERYDTWEWNYGRSPACSLIKRQLIEGCGTVEARLELEHGRIEQLCFYGDFFSAEEPEQLAPVLMGVRLEREDLENALNGVRTDRFFTGMTRESFLRLLLS